MNRVQTICLIILTTIAVAFAMAYLRPVLLPFVIALFIVIGIRPILSFVEDRLKLHRVVAIFVTFSIGVILMLAFAFMVWASVQDLARHSDSYEDRLNQIIGWVVERLPESELTESPASSNGNPTIKNVESSNLLEEVDEPAKAVEKFLNYASREIRSRVLGLASSLTGVLSQSVMILIFVFFMLIGENSWEDQTDGIVAEIESQVRKYLVVKTVISFLTGLAFGFVLWMFGVPLSIVFGFLAFLLNFIPNIGPVIATALPIPFLVLNADMGTGTAATCFALISAVQFLSGGVIEPRVMGQSFDVSPVFLLLALIFVGMIWGIVGMFLATPIVSIIKIALHQSEWGRPVAELMAGRIAANESHA